MGRKSKSLGDRTVKCRDSKGFPYELKGKLNSEFVFKITTETIGYQSGSEVIR